MSDLALRSSSVEAFVASTDLGRSRSFYEGVLLLELVDDNGFALVFDGGSARIRVTEVPQHTPAAHTVLGWSVDDVVATAEALVERGVAFADFPGMEQDDLGIWTAPGGDRVAWFRDPDGNTLSISQPA